MTINPKDIPAYLQSIRDDPEFAKALVQLQNSDEFYKRLDADFDKVFGKPNNKQQ